MQTIAKRRCAAPLRRPRVAAAWLLVVLLVHAVLLPDVTAQVTAHDYYTATLDPSQVQQLRNMDRYHYRPGLEQARKGAYQSAMGQMEFMLNYFPNHPQALAKMAEIGILMKRPELAEKYLRDAIERYPQRDETRVIYGTFLHKLDRFDAAISEYKKALELNPDSAFGHYNLGLAYVDIKDYRQANIHAQIAYRLGMSYPGLRRQLEQANAWAPDKAPSSSTSK